MASNPQRELATPGTVLEAPAAGAAITGALVLGAAAVWGALETAALLALEGATTAGMAYAAIHLLRRHRRRAIREGARDDR